VADPARGRRRLSASLPATGAARPGQRAWCGALGIAFAVASAAAMAMGGHPVQRAPAPPEGFSAPQEAETLFIKTLIEIKNNRLATALAEIEKTIQAYPNFRLAHLVKGDLLLARSQPLTTMGNTNGVPRNQIEDLREEAKARLARFQQERPVGRVPRYLLQLQPQQKYALVVDTSKYTLYVFENVDGMPRYIADYYTSIGKNGIDKNREGDKKTPLGVYHVTDSLPRDRLNVLYGNKSELYGTGAYPINYPNEWDRRQGRNGHGIWLHGVPFDTYSRPPRSSDGCVALTNEDFERIGRSVQIGLTPVIISHDIEWVTPDASAALRKDLVQALEGWRADWESLDTDKYLKRYSANFSSGKQGLADWSEHKRKVNAGKSWIKVKVDQVSMFLYPGSRNDLAVVTFEQDYSSSNLTQKSRKRQYWIKEGNSWKIIYEGAA
jgi:murein L,D-transpeptidase YafK